MRVCVCLTSAALATAAGLAGAPTLAGAQEVVPAHVHVRHLADTFRGTPERAGLLPTAVAEAEVALRHAMLAGHDRTDLEAIQRHVGHVVHALDPNQADGGPGLGYGLISAAERAAHYAELAKASDGASTGIETHAEHVATASRSAASAARSALELAEEIDGAEDAATAADLLDRLTALLEAVVHGVDADGDGRIGWQEGEGGLEQASRHLELLKQGEGIGA